MPGRERGDTVAMPIQDIINGGGLAYVQRLQEAGNSPEQVLLRLAQRFPDEAPQTYQAAVNAAPQASVSGLVQMAMGLDGVLAAGDVRRPAPGCTRWQYSVVATITDEENSKKYTSTYLITRESAQSNRELIDTIGNIAQTVYSPGKRNTKQAEIRGDFSIEIDVVETVTRVC